MNSSTAELTGKASVDKPWLKFYPEAFQNRKVPKWRLLF